MPSYNFVCKLHKALVKVTRISKKPWAQLTTDEKELLATCPNEDKGLARVSHTMERDPSGPSALVKETLDNGAMTTKIERLKDAEQLYKDRAKKNG
jgi:hypothetical protein